MKKPLIPCQQCQQALEQGRRLLTDALEREEQEKARADELQGVVNRGLELLGEAQQCLNLGAKELRNAAATIETATATERRLRDDVALYQRIQGGDVPWLIKDFNVLYRVAQRLLDTLPVQHAGEARGAAATDLRAQLERLKPAFTDTEEVRALMRARQEGR